jgi:DHA1 family tetracycline resistance protein-like MFS transporter
MDVALRPPDRRQAAFGFIFASAVMNAVSFGLMIPVLPNLVRSFFGGATAAATAQAAEWVFVFSATWGAMQFISGPLLGLLSDRFGRRPVLLISLLGLAVDFLVMAFAPSLLWLLVGRVFNGLTAASFSTANAYVADITPPAERPRRFGWLGAAFSVGFLFGPAAGGYLTNWPVHLGGLALAGLRTPFLVAAAVCAANWVYGLVVLPESLPPERRAKSFDWRRANPMAGLRFLRTHRELLPLSSVNFLLQLSFQVMPNIFVLYTTMRYGWSMSFLGVTFFFSGALQILVQFFVVGPVVRRLGQRGAVIAGAAAGVVGFLIYAFAPTGAVYFVGMPVFALNGLMGPGLQGMMTSRVSPTEQGRLQGANQSLNGIAAILGPIIFPNTFAWALRSMPQLPGLPIMIAAVFLAFALVLVVRFGRTSVRTDQSVVGQGSEAAAGVLSPEIREKVP